MASSNDLSSPLRVLEFYSGIGGMRYSLMASGVAAEVVEAFDINDTANDVYFRNFSHRPSQRNVQTLMPAQLDRFRADVWLMSPPCQPYTRQGLQKHSADARASSFLVIVELLRRMVEPPVFIFVENVVGFETSDTHEELMRVLGEIGFATQEFVLSPLQFGVPYSRPRYFCLAKRKPWSSKNQSLDGQLMLTPDPVLAHANMKLTNRICQTADGIQPIKKFLQGDVLSFHHLEKKESVASSEQISEEAEKNEATSSVADDYSVPFDLIDRWGSAMDVVFPDAKRCCCFTKSYYRYVKGTGSLLATVQKRDRSDIHSLKELDLRYFTPREVANLHSFPEEFDFPPQISLRQRYALLGNSLSVAVVAPLLCYLFTG